MKKYSLFKIVLIALLVLGVLTWFLPSSYISNGELVKDEIIRMGVFNYFFYFLSSIANFSSLMIFVFVVGGFYGVVNETGVYQNLLKWVVAKFKDKEEWFLIGAMAIIGFLTAFLGIQVALFILVPLIISVVLLMGYDKIVALSVTIGAILVGAMGTFFEFSGVFYLSQGFESDTYGEIFSKIGLFLIAMYILIMYTLKYARSVKNKEIESIAANNKEDLLFDSKLKSKKSHLGLSIIFGVIVLFMILGFVPWESVFGISWFSNFYTWIFGLSTDVIFSKVGLAVIAGLVLLGYLVYYGISLYKDKFFADKANKSKILSGLVDKKKKSLIVLGSVIALLMILAFVPWESIFGVTFSGFSIFSDIVGASESFGLVSPFGYFEIEHLTVIIMLVTLVLAFVYKIKPDEVIKNYYDGMKKVIPVALITVIIPIALVITATHGYGAMIINGIMSFLSGGFKLISVALSSIVGSVLYVQLPYSFLNNLTIMQYQMLDYDNFNLVYFVYQAFYWLAMFIAPTSIVLFMGLAYTKVSYGKWMKYVWKLLLMLVGVAVVVSLIAALV